MASKFEKGFGRTFLSAFAQSQRAALEYVLNQPTPEQRELARKQLEEYAREAQRRQATFESSQSLNPEEQAVLERQYGIEKGALAKVRPEIAKALAPTDVYNPATGQWERRGPKAKSIPPPPRPATGLVVDEQSAQTYEQTTGIPAAEFVGRKTADIRQMMPTIRKAQSQAEALMNSQRIITKLKSMYDGIAERGLTGPAQGGIGSLVSKATFGKYKGDLKAYADERDSAITSIRKMFSDSGAPSNFDVERYLKGIPSLAEASGSANTKWKFLTGYAEGARDTMKKVYPYSRYYFTESAETPQAIGRFTVKVKE